MFKLGSKFDHLRLNQVANTEPKSHFQPKSYIHWWVDGRLDFKRIKLMSVKHSWCLAELGNIDFKQNNVTHFFQDSDSKESLKFLLGLKCHQWNEEWIFGCQESALWWNLRFLLLKSRAQIEIEEKGLEACGGSCCSHFVGRDKTGKFPASHHWENPLLFHLRRLRSHPEFQVSQRFLYFFYVNRCHTGCHRRYCHDCSLAC